MARTPWQRRPSPPRSPRSAARSRIPLGVTTGAWAAADPTERLAEVNAWRVLPDFASVNWHEPGAEELAAALLDCGVGVEAGLWTPASVARWNRWPHRDRCLRVLLEVVDDLRPEHAIAAAAGLVDVLDAGAVPVLLHGENSSAWPVLADAVRRGLDIRIGLEDVLVLPDGRAARDNAALVAAALGLARGSAFTAS